jgi:hypothetical protein
MNAADMQIYCGDLKSALRAALGYDSQVFWPSPMDSSTLARIRLAQGRYVEAERLLRASSSGNDLLYVAIVSQGRTEEANAVLAQGQNLSGRVGVFSRALLSRRTGRITESKAEAEVIWSNRKCAPSLPRRLSRPILVAVLTENPDNIEAAVRCLGSGFRDLPGLRSEVLDFVQREVPEQVSTVRKAIENASRS